MGFGIFDMQTRGAGDQTTDLVVGRRPALPTEPQHAPKKPVEYRRTVVSKEGQLQLRTL